MASVDDRLAEARSAPAIKGVGLFLELIERDPGIASQIHDELLRKLRGACDLLLQARQAKSAADLAHKASERMKGAPDFALFEGEILVCSERVLDAIALYKGLAGRQEGEVREAALACLENLRTMAMERWHFPMVNDEDRNGKYKGAIERAVAKVKAEGKRPRVLDIGAGSGLLSVYAANAGADVIAVEMNEALAEVCRAVVRLNGVEEQVRVVCCHSSELKDDVGDIDVIVSEIVDAALLGEHVLPTIARAKKQFPDAAVVPLKAKLVCTPIECDSLWRMAQNPRKIAGVRLPRIGPAERYSCEDLRRLPHRILGPRAKVAVPLDGSAKLSHVVPLELPITSPGRLDGWSVSFELFLDEEEDAVIKSLESEAWDTALHFGDSRRVEEGKMKFQVGWTTSDVVLEPDTPVPGTEDGPKFELPERDFELVHDSTYWKSLVAAFKRSPNLERLLDISGHPLPIAAVSYLLNRGQRIRDCVAVLRAPAGEAVEAFQGVAEANGVGESVSVFECAEEELIAGAMDETKKMAILCADLVESSGLLRGSALLQMVATARSVSPPPQLFPAKLRLYLCAIESSELVRRCRVDAGAQHGADLGPLEGFAVPFFQETALPRTKLKYLSQCTESVEWELAEGEVQEALTRITVIADGTLHAIAYWFDIHWDESGAPPFCTLSGDPSAHMRQAGVFTYPFDVSVGDAFDVKVQCTPSGLRLTVQ